MTKSNLAKVAAWLGAAVTSLSLQGAFGKYSSIAGTAAALLTAWAAHQASDTSAGHPNGKF